MNKKPIAVRVQTAEMRDIVIEILKKKGYEITLTENSWAYVKNGHGMGNFDTCDDKFDFLEGDGSKICLWGYKEVNEPFVFDAETQMGALLEYLNKPEVPAAKELKLNSEYTAVVDRDVKVGCQNFSFDKILELAEMVRKRIEELKEHQFDK